MPSNGLWEMLNGQRPQGLWGQMDDGAFDRQYAGNQANGPAPESQLWGQVKNAWANPNQQALLGFGGGAQNGNDVGLFGKLAAPIPGMDPSGQRTAQGLPEAVANTAHSLSPNGLFDMAHGVYDAANRLTTPVDDNKGYHDQGDSYVPYNGAKKIADAFSVAGAMPVGGLLASGARGAESAAASIPKGMLDYPKDAYVQTTKYVETPNGNVKQVRPPQFGATHEDALNGLPYMFDDVSGFRTRTGQLVDRKQAMDMASKLDPRFDPSYGEFDSAMMPTLHDKMRENGTLWSNGDEPSAALGLAGVSRFANQGIKAADGSSMTLTDMYEHYHGWAEKNGHDPLSLQRFKSEIDGLGYTRQNIAGRDRYVGVEPDYSAWKAVGNNDQPRFLDMETPKSFDSYELRPEHNKTAQAMYGKYMSDLPRHLQDNVSDALIERNWNAPAPQPKTVANDAFVGRDGSTFFSNSKEAALPGLFAAGASRDGLGYTSGALDAARALPQAKGTPEQMLAMLKKGGAKQGEIEATNLGQFLDGKPSVTRDEIAQYLEKNRVGLSEVQRGLPDRTLLEAEAKKVWGVPYDKLDETQQQNISSYLRATSTANGTTKWQPNSLDPSNPTYRETVLHLPGNTKENVASREQHGGMTVFGMEPEDPSTFRSGHFPEPNITGHMMTSMTRHDGKPVFTLDQIQSDWGQNIRDHGVKSDERTKALEPQVADAWRQFQEAVPDYKTRDVTDYSSAQWNLHLQHARLNAELKTAKSGSPGHPLVNTTDQWTNTTLRRAIQQAVESGADHIAIPHGDTVLSYNPGKEKGMRGFYGTRNEEGIVPKNLRKILAGIDKDAATPQRVTELETPSGKQGYASKGNDFDPDQTGFTLFPITDKVRQHVKANGLPLFSNPAEAALPGLFNQNDQQLPGIFGGPH